MKKTLLIALSLGCFFFSNAQKHIATAKNAKNNFQLKHSNILRGSPACDTLKLDSAINYWSPQLNSAIGASGPDDDGFSFGVSYLDDGKTLIQQDVNVYDVSGTDYTYVTGGLIYFAIANTNVTNNLNKSIEFKVYDDLNGSPNQALDSVSVTFGSIKADVDGGYLTEFLFSKPVAIPAGKVFYVGVDHSNLVWNTSTRDSLGIVCDSNNQASSSTYQFIKPTDVFGWVPSNQFWYDADGNPLNVDLYIFPYVNNSANGCSALPVSLINFNGSLNDKNQAYLTWNTANEINNKGFSVERSNDGRNFTDIGFVAATHNTKPVNDYAYTDVSSINLNAKNYYRLKQIDNDGKFTYSKIVTIMKNIVDFKLYPNPIKDNLNVQLNLTSDSKVNVQLISKDGKVLMNADKGTLKQGAQQLSFNISNVAAGSYFVRIKAGDKYYTQTIIKQ